MASLLSPRTPRAPRSSQSSGRRRGADQRGAERRGSDRRRTDDHDAEPTVALEATVPLEVGRPPSAFAALTSPRYGWAVLAVVGGLAAAVFGWVVVTGLTVVGWLSAVGASFPEALGVGSELWLLSNGAGADLAGSSLTLTPIGVTLVWVFMLGRFARVAARHVPPDTSPRATTWRVSGVVTAAYVVASVIVLGIAAAGFDGATADPARLLRAVVAAVLIAGPITWWEAARVARYRPTRAWPRWARAVPLAVAGAVATLVLGGAAALTASIVAHLSRVTELWSSLDAGVAGGVVLLVLQLAYVPSAVVWSTAYTLGAGFGLGPGSLVAPRAVDVGILPALPMFGAVPAEGAGSIAQLGWLGVGVAAGVVAALVVVRARRAARVDETALVGGLAGVVAGLVATGIAWFTTGGLGTGRLAHLGPDLLGLLVIAPVTLGLSGMVTGMLAGLLPLLVRRLRGT